MKQCQDEGNVSRRMALCKIGTIIWVSDQGHWERAAGPLLDIHKHTEKEPEQIGGGTGVRSDNDNDNLK